MSPAVGSALGAAWAVLALSAVWGRRPRPVRHPSGCGRRDGGRPGPVGRAGGWLRRVAGRPPDRRADRAVGVAVLASVALLAVAPPLAPLPWGLAVVLPRRAARRKRIRAEAAWGAAVPDTVDLFALALGAGLAVPGALGLVAPRAPPPLGPALVRADLRVRHGEPLDAALDQVVQASPVTRPLVAVLVAAHCDGAPAAEPLARVADDLRATRRRQAEARARQVPVRMLFPLVGCTLPAFVLVTVVPAVVVALADLQL